MGQGSSWQANWLSSSQETPYTVQNLHVHYCVPKSLTSVPTMSHKNYSMPSHPMSLISTLITSYHLCPSVSSGFFPSGSPTRCLHSFSFFHMHATYPAHLILLNLIIMTLRGEEHISWSSSCSSSCHFLQPPATSSCLDQNTFLSLFTKTSPYILLFMWQINLWYPHKTGGVHGAVGWGTVLKPGHVFSFWWGSLGFFIHLILLAAPCPQHKWVPGMFPAGKCGQWVKLPCHLHVPTD